MNVSNYLSSLLIAFFLVAASVSCKDKVPEKGKPKETPPVLVDIMTAEPQPISDVIEANGTVVANEYTELRPEVSGRLTYLNITEGSPVAAGSVLAKINDADLRATLAKTRVQLDLAQKTQARFKQLVDVGGINLSDYDEVVNQVNGYRADMQYTQAMIEKTVIRAPFSGVAGLRKVSPGAYVTPATVLVTIQQTSQAKVDFTLPEMYSNAIHKGQVIQVELDAASGKRGEAMILAMEPGANTQTRNLQVRAMLADPKVNPGAFAKIYIDAGKGRSSVMVPTNAIIPNDKNNQVVLLKNGVAVFTDVKTGVRQANNIEILSGLNAGDSVVVTGVLFARPKSKLKVKSVKTLSQLSPSDSSTVQ